MNIENKICILLNWSREIDMYDDLINLMPEQSVELVINDIKTLERERIGNALDTKNNLIFKKKKFKYFSEVYKKKKYKIILSTGLACSLKITIYSVLKFLYGRTIGHVFDMLNISKIFVKLFKRPFNAGGKQSRIGSMWYPEKIIAKKSIKYSNGMDLKLKYYPHKDLKKNFDIFFTHSEMESSLIMKKFSNKTCKIIGYPRYNDLKDRKEIFNNLKNEFNLKDKKKIIFWTPTHIHYKNETATNFLPWIDKISELNSEYNIIIRPHPKILKLNKTIKESLTKKGFLVDDKVDRKIGNLFKVSDLILCDYGDTIFSAIYLEKPLVLLNMDSKSDFIKDLNINLSLDLQLRNYIVNYDVSVDIEEFKREIFKLLNNKNNNKILDLKKKYFGNINSHVSSIEAARFLQSFLN